MRKIYILLLIIIATITGVVAQVGIDTTTANASTAMDISSVNKGLLIPQMTDAQRSAITNSATRLDVASDIKYLQTLFMGLQYIPTDCDIPANNVGTGNIGCPTGLKPMVAEGDI